ncbi:MAG: DUF2309 domain-containing protein [Halobacteria archaeon]
MNTESEIMKSIETAADSIGYVWPLHSFVTANPLAGFEDKPFHEAVEDAEDVLGGSCYPSAELFRKALKSGKIDREMLSSELAEHGYRSDPEVSLEHMEESEGNESGMDGKNPVDSVLTKWLSSFLDQGQSEWPMPDREKGFYSAFRELAPYDEEVPGINEPSDLPEKPIRYIEKSLEGYPEDSWHSILERQLAELPGWTGFIKQRISDETPWQKEYPISLTGYLAVRLGLADGYGAEFRTEATSEAVSENEQEVETGIPVKELWLQCWEKTYRSELVNSLTDAARSLDQPSFVTVGGKSRESRPDAQMVFCIDTRSEIIRRHIEEVGDYETHGYAGFFGIPMRYSEYDLETTVDACPPVVEAEHYIEEEPVETDNGREEYHRYNDTVEAAKSAIESLETNAATAFSFVENAGVGYGMALAAKTLLPTRLRDFFGIADRHVPDSHEFCDPDLDHEPGSENELPTGLTVDEKIEYAATAFELMGWKRFSRIVLFVGHASRTENNPFDSSLDCGACAANPGGPSARVLASICNEDIVRRKLRDRGIDIPDDTVFLAGEHNTTTDEIELYTESLPDTHQKEVESLRSDLVEARRGATEERAGKMGTEAGSGLRETERRAHDWAETRPEWGLAGNAGFVVGPRSLTEEIDLDGRTFLHSYDWETDPEGEALEAIMSGPMVVTQWINSQYYFSTVDNSVYGSGSKITQNPVGNLGVYQGNGGDLMTGLPLQSLMASHEEPYHQPIRLTTFIHAPVQRVEKILSGNKKLKEILDNNWLSLTVIDPEQNHRAFHYDGELNWIPVRSEEPEKEDLKRHPLSPKVS